MLFLSGAAIIYLFALLFCSKERRDGLLEGSDLDSEVSEGQSEIELEEYTVNGSESEGDEEEKGEQETGIRRMRVRRRGTGFLMFLLGLGGQNVPREGEGGMGDLLALVFKKGRKKFKKKKEKSQKQKEVDKEICPICQVDFEDKDEVIELKCSQNHIFHEACIKDWLVLKQDCPLCRKEIFEMNYSQSSMSKYRSKSDQYVTPQRNKNSQKSEFDKCSYTSKESSIKSGHKISFTSKRNELSIAKELLKENNLLRQSQEYRGAPSPKLDCILSV